MTALSPVTTMFVAILVTFVCTRLVTRHIRSRETPRGAFNNVAIGGVHIHHQVFGIIAMFRSGVALIAATPEGAALHVAAAFFGVGVSLTFDEFALWLHLDDVYWTENGRKSMALALVSVLKGKVVTGVIGVFFSPVALVGAVRLAKPPSVWGRRRYVSRPKRMARAERASTRRTCTGAQATARSWNLRSDAVSGASSAVALRNRLGSESFQMVRSVCQY